MSLKIATGLCLIALWTPSSYGGPQNFYTGVDATGRLTKSAVTNASTLAAQATALRAFSNFTQEIKQHIVTPRRSTLGISSVGTLAASPVPGLAVNAGPESGFLGLTHYDQRNSNGGNQYSVEPPSPSLAVGNGYVLQGVNNAIQVFTTSGAPLLAKPISTNQLFGLPPALDRSTGINGPFPTDMQVFYDQQIDRWVVLQRAQDYDPAGFPLNSSHLYMAVSQTGDPTAFYNVYTMNTTNAGRPGCPCFSDFPQIGADRYGIYVSVDEFDTFFGMPVDASILAISKAALGSGAASPAMQEIVLPRTTGYERTVRPAVTPPGASYFLANGGVEYFVSTLSLFSSDNTFSLWALINTSSIDAKASLTMIQTVITGADHTYPDVATQRPGPIPYGTSLNPANKPAFLDGGGDSRVFSVIYSGGRLFLSYATQALDETSHSVVAGAYAILSPTYRSGVLAAALLKSGYLVVKGNHVLRPAIAVNAQGRGAISFTLVGPDYFPSAAFVPVDLTGSGTTAQVTGIGFAPEDGFTGYPDPVSGTFSIVARWGDYSGAVVAPDGSIWMTAEYIPNSPRTISANWGTRVFRYIP